MRLFLFRTAAIAVALLGCSDLGDPFEYRADCDRAPGGIDFGSIALGRFQDATVVIANSGTSDLEGEVRLSDPHFSILSGEGRFVVPPGGELRVVLRCAPKDTGMHRAEVEIGGVCGPVAVAVLGTPPPEGPQCVLDPPALAFEDVRVDETAERSVDILNVGLIDFEIDVALSGAGAFEIVGGAGPGHLDPGDTVRVTVKFAPASAGEFDAEVTIGSTCDVLPVSGTATPKQTVSFADQIQPIFNENCVVCHGSRGQAGLDLRALNSYANLVNRVSTGYAPALRVAPGDPDASVLYNKVADTGVFGQRMPPPGQGLPLPSASVQLIRTWILEGAVNN
jgi:hypothetical protein